MHNTTLVSFNRCMTEAVRIVGLAGHYTAHSARAGFATDAILSGESFSSVREEGRWLSDQSLRVYLDAVAVAAQAASKEAAMWSMTIHQLTMCFAATFPWWPAAPLRPRGTLRLSPDSALRIPVRISRDM